MSVLEIKKIQAKHTRKYTLPIKMYKSITRDKGICCIYENKLSSDLQTLAHIFPNQLARAGVKSQLINGANIRLPHTHTHKRKKRNQQTCVFPSLWEHHSCFPFLFGWSLLLLVLPLHPSPPPLVFALFLAFQMKISLVLFHQHIWEIWLHKIFLLACFTKETALHTQTKKHALNCTHKHKTKGPKKNEWQKTHTLTGALLLYCLYNF